MPKIEFAPFGKTIEVASGTTLYQATLQAKLPIASSCDGEFTCGKCNVIVLAGEENLTRQGEGERELLVRENRPITHRIACVALARGDCKITTTYW